MENLLLRSFFTSAFTRNRLSNDSSSSNRIGLWLIALLTLAGSFGIAGSAHGQTWMLVPASSTIPNFGPGEIRCVRFLDKVGAPNIGFVADSSQIWRTDDTGKTWALATLPTGSSITWQFGWVNDFTFADSLNGFAAVQGNVNPNSTFLISGVIKTTDGGQTWNFVVGTNNNFIAPDSANGIYYNPKSNLLFVAGLDNGLVVSPDKGLTWSTILDSLYFTGFAFIDDVKGVVATEGSNAGTFHYWLRTLDEGKNWSRVHMNFECWQPVGISTTSTYFAPTAIDYDLAPPNNQAILRSDNNGDGFGPVPVEANGFALTQSAAGDGCSLFASSTNQGMFVSINDGATWLPMPLPPNPSYDTRFYVSPTTIWSFQNDSLYSAPRPNTADIHVWPQTINFGTAGCVAVDTTIHIFPCNCSKTPLLTGDSLHRLTLNTTDTFSPISISSQTICPVDSVVIKYRPTTANPDTADFHLLFTDGSPTVIVDTIHVTGGGVLPGLGQIPGPDIPGHNQVSFSVPACAQFDTFVTIFNPSCSIVKITQIDTADDGAGEGPCVVDVELPTLPFDMNPGAVYNLPIHFNGGLQKATYCILITVTAQSGSQPVTPSPQFVVCGEVNTNIEPLMEGFNTEYKSCCNAPDSQFIYLNDTTCDTITLQPTGFEAAVNITSPGFSFDSLRSFPPIHFPYKLAPGKVLQMRINLVAPCKAGTYKDTVTFNGTVGTASGQICNAIAPLVNAKLPISYKIDADAPTSLAVSPTKFNFGTVSCCDTTQVRTVTLTGVCVLMTYKGITSFNSGGGHFEILWQPPVGTIFKNGDTGTIEVRFIPPPCSSAATVVNGGLYINSVEYPSDSLFIGMSGSSSLNVAVSQSADTINYDTLKFCSAQICDSITLTNTSCTPGKINSILQPGRKSFQLTSPAPNTPLPEGASVPVVVCFTPGTPGDTGALADKVVFRISDNQGNGTFLDTVNLAAFVTPPVPGFSNTTIASDSLCAGASTTETFIVTNTGDCYTYNIVSGSTTDPSHASVSPQTASIPVNGVQTFTVTFTADAGSITPLTGTITLTDANGNKITEPYDIPVKSCTTGGTFTLTIPGGGIVITPNCTNGLLIFTAGAGGGTGAVTGVSVTPPGRFSVTNPIGGPMSLIDTVIFNPNLIGGNNASLQINYNINGVGSSDTTISLTGIVTGAKDSARIGITSPADTCILPNGTDIKELDIVLQDTIQDALGMTQVSFLIHYNGNLLWNPKFLNPGPGWTLGSWYQDTMGIHVTMIYNDVSGRGFAAAGDVIVQVDQFGALSKFLSTTAYIDSTHFNDSAYEACTMKALSAAGQQVQICIDTMCNTNIMLKALQGNLQAIDGIEVIPNPAHKDGTAATVHFTTNIDGVVSADVLDVLGNSVMTLSSNSSFAKGDHALPIPTENISEGTYFVRIQVGGYTVVQKFSLQKE